MKQIRKFRVNYFGSESFWVCEDTTKNREILRKEEKTFSCHTFMAADGSIVSRLEWND